MHFTFQQLRILESVARNLSFTRASEELFLTQPAISIQIKRLEHNIGHALFEQIGKRLYLTDAGQELFQVSQEILSRLDVLEETLSEHHGKIRGPLKVSVVTTAKYFMPHLLGAFLREHDEVEPRLNVTNRAKILERLKENRDDLVVMGQAPEGLNLQTIPFIQNRLVVVAHASHPLAKEKSISLEQISHERFLVREEGSGTRSAVDRLFAQQGLQITPYMELGSSEAIKQGVMAGLGVSVLSNFSVHLELASGLLAVLEVEGFPLVSSWHCVYQKGKRLSKTPRAFLDFLLREGDGLLSQSVSFPVK